MNWRKTPTWLYLIGFLAVVVLSVVFYFVIGRKANLVIDQQLLQQQRTLTRAQSNNLTSIFKVMGGSVAGLSQSDSVVYRRDAVIIKDMEAFMAHWRDVGLIGGLTLTDEKGIVEFNVNVSGNSDVGNSLADRDYFLWAKNQASEGEYFIDQSVISRLGASKGESIVPVASTVVQDGVFKGVLVLSVRLQALCQQYLRLMRISDMTHVYLIDEQGRLLYNNIVPKMMGKNLLDFLAENSFLDNQILANKLKDILNTKKEGESEMTFLDPETNKKTLHLITYSPVVFNNQTWTLIMSTPVQDAGGDIIDLQVRVKMMFLFLSLTILFYGAIIKREVENRN